MTKPFPSLTSIHTVAFDFDGVFTDNHVWLDQDGKESVRCNRADGLAFDMVRVFQKREKCGIDFFILTKESNPVVISRSNKLKLACYHGIGDKLLFMESYLASRKLDVRDVFEGLIYLGNDLNDFPLMCRAGYAVAPKDAHPLILSIANLVLTKRGGEGCVREFIECFLLRVDLFTQEELHEFISDC